MIDEQYLLTRFRHHPPINQDQVNRYEAIRERGLYFAQYINEHVPDSREKNLAIDCLRESVMWANAGIACNEVGISGTATQALPILPLTGVDQSREHPSFPEPFRGRNTM
jgi:hypothetical protein